VHNPSHYAQAAELSVLPNLDNTLFYFDEDARTWRARRAGVVVPTDSQWIKRTLALPLAGHATTTVYVLVNLDHEPRLLLPTGYAYTFNNVLMHLNVVLMLLGLVQMTRAYLATPARLPRLDAALRYALGVYCVFAVVVAAVNLNGFLLN
jgi:hypothetical protein